MAKRLNTRMLLIVAAIAVALVTVLTCIHLLTNRDPRKFIALGEKAVAEKRYDAAAAAYRRAISLDKGNNDLVIRYGEIMELRVAQNPDSLTTARGLWEDVLVNDPRNRPALEHLLTSYIEEMELRPGASIFGRVRDTAAKLHAADPDNLRAAAYQHIATVLQATVGVTTSPAALEASLAAMEDLAANHPADPDLLFYTASARLRQAVAARKGNDPEKAARLVAGIRSTIDRAVATQHADPAVDWRVSQLDFALAQMEESDAARLIAAGNAAIARAQAAAKPDDLRFVEINVAAATALARQGKAAEAEAIRRETYRLAPNSGVPQLELGHTLAADPAKREEAVRILSQPITGDGLKGFKALGTRQLDAQRVYELTMLRIELCQRTNDAQQRQTLLDKIEDGFRSYSNLTSGESVQQLRMKGYIQELKGEKLDAVGTFHRAVSLMEHNGQHDYDLMLETARLDLLEGQTGSAARLLTTFASEVETAQTPRAQLVDLYLGQNNLPEAQKYLEQLVKLAPNAVETTRLRIAYLIASGKPEASGELYARLPETTRGERIIKARAASALKRYAEAIRLLQLVHAESPADANQSVALAQAYLSSGDKDKARAIMAEAVTRQPDDLGLAYLRGQFDDASPEQLQKLAEQYHAAGATNFSRELDAARASLAQNQLDAAAAHLAAADKLQPESKFVHDQYFQLYLLRHDFERADAEVRTLTRLDADEAGGWVYRAKLATAKGDFASAIKAGRQLVSRRADFAQSYVILAQAYQAAGDFDSSLKEFNNALERQNNNAEALQGAAQVSLAMRDLERAKDYIARGRSAYPQNADFRQMSLNFDLAHSAHPETVVDERARLLNESPDDPQASAALAEAAMQVGRVKTDPAAARKFIQQARDVATKGVARWPDDARLNAILAEATQAQGDEAGGEKILKAFAERPAGRDKAQPMLMLADYYVRSGKWLLAEGAARQAYTLSGHTVEIEQRLAAVLMQQGRLEEALTLLADNASDPRIARQRLEAQIAAGHTVEAERGIREALAASPDSPELLNMLTSLYMTGGRLDDARAAAKHTLATNPRNDNALYLQAAVELRQPDGDLDLALKDLLAARERNPQNVAPRIALADLYQRRSDFDSAIHELRDCLATAPLNRDVRLRLLFLYQEAHPPRWKEFDALLDDALANPRIGGDVAWQHEQALGLAAREQYAAAIAKMRDALASSPGDPVLQHDLLSLMHGAKDYAGVIREADVLLARDPKPWWAYLLRGLARSASDHKTGLEDFDAALALVDATHDDKGIRQVVRGIASNIGLDEAIARVQARCDRPPYRALAIGFYREKGDDRSAIRVAQAMRDKFAALGFDEKVLAVQTLGECHESLKAYDASKEAFAALVQLTPDDPIALNNFACMLADDIHQPAEAKRYSQKALQIAQKLGTNVPTVADTHGWVLTLCGGVDARTGLDLLQQTVEENQEFLDARYHLVQAYLRLSQAADAQKHAQIALGQVKAIEDANGSVRPELKAGLNASLAQAKQMLSGKADAGNR